MYNVIPRRYSHYTYYCMSELRLRPLHILKQKAYYMLLGRHLHIQSSVLGDIRIRDPQRMEIVGGCVNKIIIDRDQMFKQEKLI